MRPSQAPILRGPSQVQFRWGVAVVQLWSGPLAIEGLTPYELRERCAHPSRPAGEVLGGDSGDVDGFDFAGEIVERDTNQDGGRGAEEAVDGVHDPGGIGERIWLSDGSR